MQDMKKVLVWDMPVRVFHWLLVLLLVFQYATYKIGYMAWHLYGGYAILVLVLFRFVWGFVGGTHARFGDFLYGPRAVIGYVKTLPKRQAAKFAGHNPLGGYSVLLMLAAILIQATTGLFSNDDISTEGPLAQWIRKETSDAISTVHRYNFYVLLALVAAHVGAVLFYLIYKSENLVKAMFTGHKMLSADHSGTRIAGAGLALIVLAIAAGVVYLVINWKWQ